MRIDQLNVKNFKRFTDQSFELHPQFTLFVGDNGSGKTSVLDALAVAAGIWLVVPPDSALQGSGREIAAKEIRLEPEVKGDRVQFRELRPASVRATGSIGKRTGLSWTRQVRANGKRTTNAEAKEALKIIKDIFDRDTAGEDLVCPVLAYYGAGRAWLPSNQRRTPPHKNGPARRWAAFYDCFNERIRFAELQEWFKRESLERGNRNGRWRPGFDVVRQAILRCVPSAADVRFDTDRDQVVLTINGETQPFDNLSAGQRMMVALVADLAIKAVTQNAFLVTSEELEADPAKLPPVLQETTGLVLIDELDVHLHPKWQRRVAKDLKTTFPGIQFVCTSHSPQVLGELEPEEIRLMGDAGVTIPPRSFGIDSSRILEEIMDAPARNEDVDARLRQLFHLIDQERFAEARSLVSGLTEELGEGDPDITRADALMTFLETDE